MIYQQQHAHIAPTQGAFTTQAAFSHCHTHIIRSIYLMDWNYPYNYSYNQVVYNETCI